MSGNIVPKLDVLGGSCSRSAADTSIDGRQRVVALRLMFSSTGVTEPGTLTIDATTAEVIGRSPGSVQ